MKNAFATLALPLFTLLLCQAAAATGGMEGGGGGAAVCRDDNNNITFAEMEDLFEAPVRWQYVVPVFPGTPDQLLANAIGRIHDSFNATAVAEAAALTVRGMRFLPPQYALGPTSDLGNQYGALIPSGKNCKIEPVGFYDSNGTLEISRDVYAHLDSTNKAAFVLHEAMYKLARETAGESDSADARHAVAALFAAENEDQLDLVEKVVFPYFPSEWADRKFFTANVIVSHPDTNFTLKVKPKNEGDYKLSFMPYTFGAYRAGVPFPYFDGMQVRGEQEMELVDNYDLTDLVVVLSTFSGDPEKNKVQTFDYQILDDTGAVIYSGTTEPSGGNPVIISLALARKSLIPAIPSL